MYEEIKALEEKVRKYREQNNVETEDNYKKKKDYVLDLNDLIHISSRFYGSHEYSIFINNYLEDIFKLSFNDKFKLLKELYCTAKDCSTIGDIIQALIKNKKVPSDELENIKKNFKSVAYRGYNGINKKDGCSYTLDFDVAKWFSRRFKVLEPAEMYVMQIKIKLEDVIFYNEYEKEVFIRKDKLDKKKKNIIYNVKEEEE